MDYTPGRGSGAATAATAAVLPATGADWAIPAAISALAVLVVWGMVYAIKNRSL